MKEDRIRAVLEVVAQNNHTTVEEVKMEIELSIAEAIKTAIKNNDTKRLKKWKNIPCRGEVPTAEELLAYLTRILEQ